LVHAGDVIVADGDGVIVVPREYAAQVSGFAREIMNKDKADGVTFTKLKHADGSNRGVESLTPS
jgi:regulator of RNase E activity RraA